MRTLSTQNIFVGFSLVCALGISSLRPAHAQNGHSVSQDLFGEPIDLVTPGYFHWSTASGDTVDPDDDANDFDNNFGEHAGHVDEPSISSQIVNYGQGSVGTEFAYCYGTNTVQWEFHPPEPGSYVFATMVWKELTDPTTIVFSYKRGDQWIDLPAVEDILEWPDFGTPVCMQIDVSQGQTTLPMRARATSGRGLLYRLQLARLRTESPFITPPTPTEHPALYFKAADIPALRAKILQDGPAKTCYDYMVGQMSWYRRDVDNWTSQSSHAPGRAIIQTAYLYVITEYPVHLESVLAMIDKILSFYHDPDAVRATRAGQYNILERGRQLSAIVLAYDWLYEQIPPAKRDEIRQFMDLEATRLFVYTEYLTGDFASGNWDPWIGAGYGMVGVLFRDEHKWARKWIDPMKRIFGLNLRLSGEDFGYFMNGFTKALDFGICLKTATGEDLFATYEDRLKALMDYRMILLTPKKNGYPTFGDASAGNDPVLGICLTAFLDDAMSQWYLNHLSCGTRSQVNRWGWNHMMPVCVAVFYQSDLPEEIPNTPRLPLAKSFAQESNLSPGLQPLTVMRTGYDNTNDIQFSMRCGDYAGWHGHPSQGSFMMKAYGDDMTADRALGAPYGTPESDFSKSADAHSIVLIDGEGQEKYSDPVYGRDLEAGHPGPLLHSELADYMATDNTIAYRKNPSLATLDHAYRYFLMARKPNRHAYVIVVDDIKLDDLPHEYTWLLQTDTSHFVTTSPGYQFIANQAELHVFTAEPYETTATKTDSFSSWRTLKIKGNAATEHGWFAHLLYPKSGSMPLPEITRINDGNLAGFALDDDLILFHKGAGTWNYKLLQTDARLIYLEMSDPQETRYLVADATTISVDGNEVFEANEPITTTGSFAGGIAETDPPTIVAWCSGCAHGPGIEEALLEIPDDGSFSEPRSCGISTLVLTFSEPMDPVDFAGALVEIVGLGPLEQEIGLGGVAIATETRGDGTEGVITFTPPLPDLARYVVRISGVTDLGGNSLSGDNDRIMTGLVGDVSGDWRVNAVDFSRVRTARTKLIDPGDVNQVRADVSCDGRVNASDFSRVRANRGNDARAIGDPVLEGIPGDD